MTEDARPRLCFVIMPFSSTASCTEDEWASIFRTVIKPAVEEAGLGYECHRSTATRGNVIGQIMESLRDGHVVIADLTDRNANVFYELGVRHALTNRTILIAQDRDAIPFDLRPYANHVYGWKSREEIREFKTKIRELLLEIDERPDRPDNPVSDFLKSRAELPATPPAPPISREEAVQAQTLAGSLSEGVEAAALGELIARTDDSVQLRTIVRLTHSYFQQVWPKRIQSDSLAERAQSAAADKIYDVSLPYIREFEVDTLKLEEFGLALIDADRFDLVLSILRILEDWISLSERVWHGTSVRPVTGAPALLALRLLANWSAKTIDNLRLDGLGPLLLTPLQAEDEAGGLTSQPLVERGNLFYSEAFLGYANLTSQYIRDVSWENEGVRKYFASQRDYLAALAVFFFVVDLLYVIRHPGQEYRIYPAFRLIDGGTDAVCRFIDRLANSAEHLRSFSTLVNEDPQDFKEGWAERIRPISEARLGGITGSFRQKELPHSLG